MGWYRHALIAAVLFPAISYADIDASAGAFAFSFEKPRMNPDRDGRSTDQVLQDGGNRESLFRRLASRLPERASINASHIDADGAMIWFTLDIPAQLINGGFPFNTRPNQILSYDVATDIINIYWDGSSFGIPERACIDALYLDSNPGLFRNFEISLDIPLQLTVTAPPVGRPNPVTVQPLETILVNATQPLPTVYELTSLGYKQELLSPPLRTNLVGIGRSENFTYVTFEPSSRFFSWEPSPSDPGNPAAATYAYRLVEEGQALAFGDFQGFTSQHIGPLLTKSESGAGDGFPLNSLTVFSLPVDPANTEPASPPDQHMWMIR